MLVQDTYSRFPVVEVLKSTAATPVIAALDRIMSLYGIPKELGSDNGPPYQSEAMREFAKYMGYAHNHKIPYAPWANGTAEHFMRNLKKLMQVCAVEKKNWRQQLQRFLRAYRAAPHRTTGFAPATLMFNGRQYRKDGISVCKFGGWCDVRRCVCRLPKCRCSQSRRRRGWWRWP